MDRIGLNAQFIALRSVIDSAVKNECSADIRGLKAVVDAYPRISGESVSSLRKERRMLQKLNDAEPNRVFVQASQHKAAEWKSVSNRRECESSWAETLELLKGALANLPEYHPKNTFMPVKALAFASNVVRGQAPAVNNREVASTLYKHQEHNALENIAYMPIEHTPLTHKICNTGALEASLLSERDALSNVVKEIFREIGVSETLKIDELPVVQHFNAINKSRIDYLYELLSGQKADLAHGLSALRDCRQKISGVQEIDADTAMQITVLSLATSVLKEAYEANLLPDNKVSDFLSSMKVKMLEDNLLTRNMWSEAIRGINGIRSAQYSRSYDGLNEINSPIIATLCSSTQDSRTEVKDEVKEILVNALINDVHVRTLSDSRVGGFVHMTVSGRGSAHVVCVPVGYSESDLLLKGVSPVDTHISNIAKGLLKLRGAAYEVSVPEEIQSQSQELKAFFDEKTEQHSKEMVDPLMKLAQHTPASSLTLGLDTPMVNAAQAMQTLDWNYRGPEPELSPLELEALKERMKKATLAIFGEDNELEHAEEVVKVDNVKPSDSSVKPKVESTPVKEDKRPMYTGSPTQMKLF